MMRLTKRLLSIGLLVGLVSDTSGFALLGPFKNVADPNLEGLDWQAAGYGGRPAGLGYTITGTIGGPMYPFEAYRWNVPIITYAFDFTFLRYFGPEGVNAVEQAISILNALPPASQMSPTLSEFSLDTKGQNGTAAALALQDVKSYTLAVMLEEMGLANPERYVWGLRTRETGNNPAFTNYTVIQLNYDPVTIQPSRYVNGVLYNYTIIDALGPQGGEWASAVEWYQLDPLYQPYSSVAGAFSDDFQLGDSPSTTALAFFGLQAGQYYSGLTRDDVGGLRFLLSTNHMVFDTLLPTVLPRTSGIGGSPWSPIVVSNIFGTNIPGGSNIVTIGTNFPNFVRTALRPGVDKITFQRVPLLGTNFNPMRLRYTDRYVHPTTGRITRQPVERLLLQPDIIFAVRDLGTVDEIPFIFSRTGTDSWTNNAAINTFVGGNGLGGPGIITPPVVIQFSDTVPFLFNFLAGGGDIDAFPFGAWGSFDGTDRPPVVFPVFQHPLAPEFSLEYLRDAILRPNN